MPDKIRIATEAKSLAELDAGIAGCRGCPLWARATQAVYGEGSPKARIMLVGEQPGDQEDLTGKPFVGPAGRVLDEALEKAGIDRKEVYVTNAVKHFSWEPRGKRRLHKTPAQQEVAACLDWLLGEIRLIVPDIIVALGGTAVRALLGPKAKVLVNRGKFFESEWGPKILVTVQPIVDPARATRRPRAGVQGFRQGPFAHQESLSNLYSLSPRPVPGQASSG